VCFEVDEYDGRGSWRSVIVQGTYEELEGADAERALALLGERFAERVATSDGECRRRGNGPAVAFRIRLDEVSGRAVTR
jgi:nitroimidazol reductase NimA-like FMN-containing flavoprotein (pyridoxamine 5'-phosphate oxidase superfamily)